jgi:hypothetical protein
MNKQKLVSLFVACILTSWSVYGQALEPRLYSNTPVAMNFMLSGYTYSTGAAVADPSMHLESGKIDLHLPFAAYARSFGLWGKSGKFDVVVPYGFLSGTASFNGEDVERNVNGFTDPLFRVSMNLLGAPAMTLEEYLAYKQNFVIGTSVQVSAPLGQYDSDKVINLGTHRWSIKPEIGASKTVGPVIFELATAATLFTDNGDFYQGQTREQEPIYSVQGHVVYTLNKGIWMALDGTYYTGGRTTVDGNEGEDLQQNTRIGATLALPVSRHNSLKIYASTGVSTRTGSDFNTYGAAWHCRWGGGL